MSKYLSVFKTEAQYNAAADSLDYPHVSLIDTSGELKYATYPGKEVADADFADILMAEVATNKLFNIKDSEYNLTDYPLADFKPIAVCIRPKSDNTHNECVFMSLCSVRIDNTENYNSSGTQYYWGQYGVDLTSININSKTASSKEINNALKSSNFLRTGWSTEGPIDSPNSGYSAPFEIAWRYYTVGTNPGDWYLPSYYDALYMNGRMRDLYSVIYNTVKKMNSNYVVSGNYFYLAYSNSNSYFGGVRIKNGETTDSWGLWEEIARNRNSNTCFLRPVFIAAPNVV